MSRWPIIVGIAAAVGLGASFGSLTVATSGPLLLVIVESEVCRRRRSAEQLILVERLPAIIDQLIQQLRAGRSLPESCRRLEAEELSGSVDQLAPLFDRLRNRRPLAESAEALLAGQDQAIQLVGVTLRVLAGNGGPAVPALQRLRHTLVGVAQGHQRAAAESSQAVASARMLVLAPGGFAVIVALLDERAGRLYLFEPVGACCVGAAVLLSWAGWWWIQQILATAERVRT